jgi:hypothetical protein
MAGLHLKRETCGDVSLVNVVGESLVVVVVVLVSSDLLVIEVVDLGEL